MASRIAKSRLTAPPARPAATDALQTNEELKGDDIGRALISMAEAARNGSEAVEAVAAMSFASFTGGGGAKIVERTGEDWKYVDSGADVPPQTGQLLSELSTRGELVSVSGVGVFVPISAGSVGVIVSGTDITRGKWPALRVLAAGFDLALTAATQNRSKLDALEEIKGLQQIARRILSAGDLDEILFSISQETKRLLSADICGVFLRDKDQMVMRDCVGNLTHNIAKIRLGRGQGLAGRVFETGQYCVVNDYLGSDIVSQEYAELVRAERIRSALGAPLLVNKELIGVLEVWRRRKSTFTEADVRRILALASLTAIAINKASLFEQQKSTVEQLTLANEQLRKQNNVIQQSAEITAAVLQILLDGEGLTAIARTVAEYAHAEVTFFTVDLEPMAGFAPPTWFKGCLPLIRRTLDSVGAMVRKGTITQRAEAGWLSLRPVIAGRSHVGWICTLRELQPDHLHEVTLVQAAMATALNYLEERAATRARAEMTGGMLWDLLEGTSRARQTATTRAKELQIDLSGSLRLVHFTLEGLDEADNPKTLVTGAAERKLDLIRELFEKGLGKSGGLRLAAGRGSLLVAVIAIDDKTQIRSLIKAVDASVLQEVSGIRTFWGISSACSSAHQLHAAHREAAAATLLVRKLGFGRNLAMHEELGMVGLLLKVKSDADLGKFVTDTLNKVIAHDAKHHGVLIKTVRAYFECNCAQRATAKKLYVHDKTVRYRLSQFETLTGLKLNRHQDRMLVDVALAMYSIAQDTGELTDKAPGLIGTDDGTFLLGSTE